jgi:HAMP domain-containing protein
MAPPAKNMKVVATGDRPCIGCEVLVQRDENNELNINLHRQEMAERLRMQELTNDAMRESVSKLSSSVNTFVTEMHKSNESFLERIHKLEKNLVYTAILVVVAAVVSWAAKLTP